MPIFLFIKHVTLWLIVNTLISYTNYHDKFNLRKLEPLFLKPACLFYHWIDGLKLQSIWETFNVFCTMYFIWWKMTEDQCPRITSTKVLIQAGGTTVLTESLRINVDNLYKYVSKKLCVYGFFLSFFFIEIIFLKIYLVWTSMMYCT